MNDKEPAEKLADMHTHEAIAARIGASTDHSYLGDFVLGAVDGAVTTFAIVAGVAGAGLGAGVAIVLGIANLIADGFSMAAGNFLAVRADARIVDRYRAMEEMHVDHVPDHEREEIRHIFAAKGFEGDLLDRAVDVITQDRKRWVDTMLTDEWGLQLDQPNALRAGWTTFIAFILAGSLPLIPLMLMGWLTPSQTFAASAVLTAVGFIVIGAIQGVVTKFSPVRSAVNTLLIGGVAALMAYGAGGLLERLIEI
jgi:VIT1/CCC1 family predicted Fe2+/Mn2+ transporter